MWEVVGECVFTDAIVAQWRVVCIDLAVITYNGVTEPWYVVESQYGDSS